MNKISNSNRLINSCGAFKSKKLNKVNFLDFSKKLTLKIQIFLVHLQQREFFETIWFNGWWIFEAVGWQPTNTVKTKATQPLISYDNQVAMYIKALINQSQ